MVIFYQIRKHLHKTITINGKQCMNCKKKNSLRITISQKYTWLIVPIAPSVKLAEVYCENCNHIIPAINWSKDLQELGEKELATTQTPKWMWQGLYFIPLIILATVGIFYLFVKITGNAYGEARELRDERLKTLRAGQILYLTDYKAKSAENAYVFSYVKKINGDTLFLQNYQRKTTVLEDWQKMQMNDFAPYELSKTTRKFSKKKILEGEKGRLFDFNDSLTVSATIEGIVETKKE